MIRPPRGIRNLNPLNIEYRPEDRWKGLDDPPHDGRFARFTSMEFGIRAAAIILRKYQARGLTTVEKIVSTWAPAHENNVGAYVAAVCQHAGFRPDQDLDLRDADVLVKLIRAMARYECGMEVDEQVVRRGVSLAL